MTTATSRREPGQRARPSRILAAIATSIALVAAPVLVVAPAYAGGPTGYVGTDATGGEWPDTTLGLMTAGVPYSDTITAPFDYDDRYGGFVDGLPSGLEVTLVDGEPVLTVSGTPERAGDFIFTIALYGESPATLTFSGTVASNKTATTTTITAPEIATYWEIQLIANVDDATSGTVQFAIDGANVGEPQNLVDGRAEYWADVDASKAGTTVEATARFLGTETTAASSSAAGHTFLYSSTGVAGFVRQNGVPVSGAVVDLLEAPVTDTTAPTLSSTTESSGLYSLGFAFREITSESVLKTYLIRATLPDGTVLYYSSANVAGSPNVTTIALAEATGPVTWPHADDLDLLYNIPPVWTETTLATPRDGSYYSDSVAATGGTISYSVTSGILPLGLALNSGTGAITGTPECAVLSRGVSDPCEYDFEITADNGYGAVTYNYSGTLLPAGVAPTWTEESPIAFDLQSTVLFEGGVDAEGDPTISYAVTGGSLPTGLSLNAATGAITGTPECGGSGSTPFRFFAPLAVLDPCDYSFTVTATNDYGQVDQLFTGTIAAAPVIDLVLDFAAGTTLEEASTTISGSGLRGLSEYTLVMHSTPQLLFTGTTDASGAFTWNVSLPPNTPAGAHKLILTGIAPDGSTMTAEAWFTLLADGTIGAISYIGPTAYTLAFTGADVAIPVGFAAALFLLGGILVIGSRRRKQGAMAA